MTGTSMCKQALQCASESRSVAPAVVKASEVAWKLHNCSAYHQTNASNKVTFLRCTLKGALLVLKRACHANTSPRAAGVSVLAAAATPPFSPPSPSPLPSPLLST
eukprot:909051-Pleurochrysis_carterae.AAC.1